MEITKKLIDPYDLTIHLAKKNAKHPLQYDDVLAVIASEKRIDAVEIVRCKDCKHYDSICGACQNLGGETMAPSDFCSYGERSD